MSFISFVCICMGLFVPSLSAANVLAAGSSGDGGVPAGLAGAWQLSMLIIDTNANNRIDDDERRNPMTDTQDYLKLNPDGSCEMYVQKIKCRYELKPSSSGKQTLVLYDKDNTRYSRGRIFSVTKDELILLDHSSGSTFKIYRRQ
jgi:hypothetical protein